MELEVCEALLDFFFFAFFRSWLSTFNHYYFTCFSRPPPSSLFLSSLLCTFSEMNFALSRSTAPAVGSNAAAARRGSSVVAFARALNNVVAIKVSLFFRLSFALSLIAFCLLRVPIAMRASDLYALAVTD